MTYETAYKKFAGLIRRLYKIKVVGLENVPKTGGALVCCNHTALLDPAILGACIPRQIHFMAKAEAFKNPFLNKLMTKLGAFPVHRGSVDVKSLKIAISFLKAGDFVGIFPQGHRYPKVDPRTTEPKRGVAMIAHRAESGVLPVFIQTKKRKSRMFHKTTLIIGKFIPYEELNVGAGTASEYTAATEYIFDKICSLGETGNET